MTNRSSTMTSGITGEGGQFADSEQRKPVTECNLNVRVARVDRFASAWGGCDRRAGCAERVHPHGRAAQR